MNIPTESFNITNAIRESWQLFKQHAQFFIALSFISLTLTILGQIEELPLLIVLIVSIASILISIVWIKVSLAAARNQTDKLNFSQLNTMLPTFGEVLRLIGIGILTGILVLLGFVLLIIPGIYIALRLSMANFSYFEGKGGIQKSLRYSWDIAKGSTWKILCASITMLLLYLCGLILLGVGLLATYPIAMMLFAKLYVFLADRYEASQIVVPAPALAVEPL